MRPSAARGSCSSRTGAGTRAEGDGDGAMPMTKEVIQVGQVTIRFFLDGSATGGKVAMFQADVPAGAKVPVAPRHDAYEETAYGLAGTLRWTVNGKQTDVGPGDVLFIPRGAVHRFDNFSGADATMLAIVTPGVLGPAFFRDMAAVLGASKGGPPDPKAMGEVMRRHGLTPAP